MGVWLLLARLFVSRSDSTFDFLSISAGESRSSSASTFIEICDFDNWESLWFASFSPFLSVSPGFALLESLLIFCFVLFIFCFFVYILFFTTVEHSVLINKIKWKRKNIYVLDDSASTRMTHSFLIFLILFPLILIILLRHNTTLLNFTLCLLHNRRTTFISIGTQLLTQYLSNFTLKSWFIAWNYPSGLIKLAEKCKLTVLTRVNNTKVQIVIVDFN